MQSKNLQENSASVAVDLPSTQPAKLSMRADSVLGLSPQGFHHMRFVEWQAMGAERTVLCVHGLTRNGRDFDRLAQVLARRSRVVCPDVVGRGKSDWLAQSASYTYPQYLADMTALIARLGVSEVDWIGTSMGGLIGMMLAAQPNTPLRRLVLNDVGPFIPRAAVERIGSYVGRDPRFATLHEVETYLRQVLAPFGPLSDADWSHLAEHGHRRYPDGTLGLAYDPAIGDPFRQPASDVVLWPLWDAIKIPVLLLRGAQSDLLLPETAREMTVRGPRTRLVEFPGIGHAPALMAADQIATVVDWLATA